MADLQTILIDQWYQPKKWGWILWPFSKIFEYIVKLRLYCYKNNIFKSYKAPVPVIVVGNLTVGGTGKTPLVIYLAQLLQQQGLKPGIVLRGYKSKSIGAILVQKNTDPYLVGDEAVLLARRTGCPVVVARQRALGVQKLLKIHEINIILCDDGLQHYALQRDLEIAVIDGERMFGNGHCLPMGPLREFPQRLFQVDLTIVNGTDMKLMNSEIYGLINKRTVAMNSFAGKTVHAIAGIGTPKKFFQQLRNLGMTVIPHEFPDHHAFKKSDINFADYLPVLMTEKDAVKCGSFATDLHWAVPISTVVTDEIKEKFCSLVQGVING